MNNTKRKFRRPFYSEFAWAFDLIIDRPVAKECKTIASWLIDCGVLPGAALLDAGCGTGRYAIELARRGYVVHGIDLFPELVKVAESSAASGKRTVSFAVGDLLKPIAGRYDAILCRGVLNDFIHDKDRRIVFKRFAEALRPDGVLVLDVREWRATAARKIREPVFRKRVSTERGELTFTSTTALDPRQRRLIVAEQHALVAADQEYIVDYQFTMKCWTVAELNSKLEQCGFGRPVCYGAYDPAVKTGATDRLVAVARRVAS